jgi:predicted nucleic acid-binding protein
VSAATGHDGWIVDASVALKWFLPVDRDADAERARALIGGIAMRTSTLAVYEVGNILMRQSGWAPDRVETALGLLNEICGDPIDLATEDRLAAARLAKAHDLTFYDASYAAIAQRLHRGLISADSDLLDPQLATPIRDVPLSPT